MNGMQYILTFIDEATRFCSIYLLHDKSSSNVVAVLQSWLLFVQNQVSGTLKRLRTDRGRGYLGLENVTRFLYGTFNMDARYNPEMSDLSRDNPQRMKSSLTFQIALRNSS
jgi:hypothetical protein